jgi:DNA-binding transcriptional MerR regulator
MMKCPHMAFYRIKEAAEKIGVLPHVLRFWESQFPSLKPNKSTRGQRLYNEEDIENFLKIKHLLYTEGFSIPGAKKFLKEQKSASATSPSKLEQVEESVKDSILEDLLVELKDLNRIAKEF